MLRRLFYYAHLIGCYTIGDFGLCVHQKYPIALQVVNKAILEHVTGSLNGIYSHSAGISPFARQAIGCNHIIVALYVDDAKVVAVVEQLVLNSSRKPEDVLIHRIIITVQHQNTIIVALEIVALNHTIITSVKYQIFTSVGINLIIDERKFVHFLHLASNPL